MKRLGYRGILFLSAFFAFGLLVGCGTKAPPMGADTQTSTSTGTGTGTDPTAALGTDNQNANSVVQGAFDDSKDDLTATQTPTSVSGLSQQQQFCSSASQQGSAGSGFFTQLTQPAYSSGQSACFAGQVNPTYLLAQNYTQVTAVAICQRIALNQLKQVQQTPQNMQALFFWATGFLLRCAAGTVGGGVQYAGALSQGIGIRREAVRSASNILRQEIRRMRP